MPEGEACQPQRTRAAVLRPLRRRHGAAKRRKEVAKAVASVRERLQRDKKEVASRIRASMPSSSSGNGDDAEHRCRVCINHPKVVGVALSRADKVREAERLWKRQQRKDIESYIEAARLKRERALAQRGQRSRMTYKGQHTTDNLKHPKSSKGGSISHTIHEFVLY